MNTIFDILKSGDNTETKTEDPGTTLAYYH